MAHEAERIGPLSTTILPGRAAKAKSAKTPTAKTPAAKTPAAKATTGKTPTAKTSSAKAPAAKATTGKTKTIKAKPVEAQFPTAGAQPQTTVNADLLKVILDTLEENKAEEIQTIDLAGKTSIADAMVVSSGRSNRHVSAIADYLLKALKAAGVKDVRIEGVPACDWVLVDAGDVIIHIFRPEVRTFYNLEKMWSAARPGDRLAG